MNSCVHSQGFNPAFGKFASRLGQNQKVKLGKIDCDANEKSCKSIDATPLLLWLENGKTVEQYTGNRTVKLLENFVKRKLNEKMNIRN